MTHVLCQGYTFGGVRQPLKVNVGSSAPSCNLAHLKLLLMTSYGVNFMLGSCSFPTEPAMPFSGILPCREYFGATHERYLQLRTPVTLMPFCWLVAIATDHLWFKFHIGILILSYWTSYATFRHFTMSRVLWSNVWGYKRAQNTSHIHAIL